MGEQTFIGIDLGTSSVKLGLYDESGVELATVSRAYPIAYPHPGWSEQDPEDWWDGVCVGLDELLAEADRTRVAAIGVGGQMHGLVALDAEDRVLRPAILWNDGRTATETDYLNNVIGRDLLRSRTANIAFAGFTAPKLLWMRDHEPELFARIAKILLPKDFINYRLTGVHATDFSDASGMLLLDVEHRRWSQEMLELCGVREEQMPRLFESYEPIGNLRADIADGFGLARTVVVCAGAGDNAAAAVSAGCIGDGACNISLGTSGTIFISSDRFRVDPDSALHAFAHADGRYHLMGCMLSAASCQKWWLEDVLETDDYAGSQIGIVAELLGRNPIFFLPYLMGERSPINDTDARGAFVGLSMDCSRPDLTQAVLEGVAFAIRDSLEVARRLGVDVQASTICGGGARSALWRTIIAAVLNVRLDLLETPPGPSLGSAILSMVAGGAYPDVAAACERIVKVSGELTPDPELVARYEDRYQRYRLIYPALKPVFPTLVEEGPARGPVQC